MIATPVSIGGSFFIQMTAIKKSSGEPEDFLNTTKKQSNYYRKRYTLSDQSGFFPSKKVFIVFISVGLFWPGSPLTV